MGVIDLHSKTLF